MNPFDDAQGRFNVVVNAEEQHSLWPEFAATPAGWHAVFGPADLARCHVYVDAHWADMRTRSARDEQPAAADELTAPSLFRAAVTRSRGGPAVVHGNELLGYPELDRRTNQLARHLIRCGVGPESLVAVALPRSVDLVIAVLAIIKAGGAYLPLDLSYPPARLAQMTRDARPKLLIRPAAAADPGPGTPQLVIDSPTVREACEQESEAEINPAERTAGLSGGNLLYVIFTSGSSGVPKGVAVTHAGLADLVRTQADRIGAGPGDRVLQWASISFDAAFWDISLALFSGATLVMASAADLLPGTPLQDTLAREAITHAVLPPAALSATDEGALLPHGTIMSTGDTCTPALAAKWAPGHRMFNGYGPTEVTVGASISGPITDGDEISIGVPFIGGCVYVLDERLRRVPDGVEGELYLGGSGVARGYLNRPALTSDRFPADPFGDPGTRMYRSGDRGWRRADGELFFTGRRDAQVKVRGFRVELGEVETCLATHPAVDIAVARMAGELDDATIVGYVTTVAGAGTDEASLRRHVADALPEHMVPARIRLLERFPVTANGKIDRGGLEAYDRREIPADVPVVPDGTATAVAICVIVQELLDVPRAVPGDNFFELGGHSFLATRLAARLRQRFGVKLGMQIVFGARTLDDLAGEVDAATAAR